MDTRELLLRSAYWEDPAAKAAFCDLLLDVFGLDFTAWDRAGYWDTDYRPFTLFDPDGRAVASACLYSMSVCVAGRRCTVGQVSGVATRPEWRRQGLARRVIGEALAWSRQVGHPFQYLFSDDEARGLYQQLGFVPVSEHVITVEMTGRRLQAGARRLDPDVVADRALAHRYATTRIPVSERLGVLNHRLAMFYILGLLRDCVWHIEPLDVLVLARRAGDRLTILDIIGPCIPPLAEVYPFLADPEDRRVVVRFEPDLLGDLRDLGRVGTEPLLGNHLHVRGAFPLAGPVVFPITAQA